MAENIFAKAYKPSPRKSILEELSVMEELKVLRSLPTLKDVYKGFLYRQNELKLKNGNVLPKFCDVANLVLEDIRKTWVFASLESVLLGKERIIVMIQKLVKRVSDLKAQPKSRLTSPSYVAKLEVLVKEADQLFDVSSCKCTFVLPEGMTENDIPCSNKWRTKVSCQCPLEKRVHPRELQFLLDQRGNRSMRIGSLDQNVTAHNLKIQANRVCPSSSIISKIEATETELESEQNDESSNSDDPDYCSDDNTKDVDSSLANDAICKLTDRRNVGLRSATEILNEAATSLQSPSSKLSHMTLYRKKNKLRESSLVNNDGTLNEVNFQVCFDGKKVFNMERFASLAVSKMGCFFQSLKTFRTKESCTASKYTEHLISSLQQPKNLLCVLADTTSVNTGTKGGIFHLLELYMKQNIGQDILALECLFHVNELLLHKVMTFYDGVSSSPNSLRADAVFNLIGKINQADLSPERLLDFSQCNIKPIESAQHFLSNLLDRLVANDISDKATVRDDQATMLVLACSTFRSIPPASSSKSNYYKYIYYKQETLSHARWITTCNGYLRIKLFNLFDLSQPQKLALDNIVQFILDVYAPAFCNIFQHPSAVSGPKIVLDIRNMMKASGEVSLPAKSCFLRHAVSWMNPKVVGLSLLDENPPIVDLSRLANYTEPDTLDLLWSNCPLASFFSSASATSPCLTLGTPEDWKSFRNNNMSCERLIRQITVCIVEKRVKDCTDKQSDSERKSIDDKIRGYISHAFY